MTLRVITGTIIDAKDTFGIMQNLINEGVMVQWVYSKQGWSKHHIPCISTPSHGKFSIIQPVGAGKTVLGATYVYMSHLKGIQVGGNLSLAWTENNHKKDKSEWAPVLNNMEDIEAVSHMHILLDDIRRTIMAWNTKDAKMVSEVANASGKKQNWLDITTQRIQNFVPPDLMMLCDEIIVPYIRAKDTSIPTPRGQGKPIQIIAFRFSPGYELLSYKVYNYQSKAGEEILEGFDTLQVATGLTKGNEDGARTDQPGYTGEKLLYDYLQALYPDMQMQLKNGKGTMDIETPVAFIDHKGISSNGKTSRLNMKTTLGEHKDYCKLRGTPGWVAFLWNKEYKFIKITSKYLLSRNPTITPALLAASRSHKSVFG